MALNQQPSFESTANKRSLHRSRDLGRAFTMVELLVVVAVIGLLLGILLPALSRAREQARLTVCLNHTREITLAATSYTFDYDNNWPIFPCYINLPNKHVEFSSWSHGGKTTSDFWLTYPYTPYRKATQAPLNKYIFEESDLVDPPGGRKELEIWRCPSDPGTMQRGFYTANNGNDPTLTCYDDVGTSYQMNVRWWYYAWQKAGWPQQNMPVWERYQGMFRTANFKTPARFAWMYDQNMDYIANANKDHAGDHGGFNRAVAAYMDGHIGYTDVTKGKVTTENYTLLVELP